MNRPSTYDAAREMLTAAATAFTGAVTLKGCLLASVTASGSSESAEVQRAVADIRAAIDERLRAYIERDVAADILPSDTNAAALSGLVMTVIQGMSTLARDGASRARLLTVVEAAMRAWPAADPLRVRPRRTGDAILYPDKHSVFSRKDFVRTYMFLRCAMNMFTDPVFKSKTGLGEGFRL